MLFCQNLHCRCHTRRNANVTPAPNGNNEFRCTRSSPHLWSFVTDHRAPMIMICRHGMRYPVVMPLLNEDNTEFWQTIEPLAQSAKTGCMTQRGECVHMCAVSAHAPPWFSVTPFPPAGGLLVGVFLSDVWSWGSSRLWTGYLARTKVIQIRVNMINISSYLSRAFGARVAWMYKSICAQNPLRPRICSQNVRNSAREAREEI